MALLPVVALLVTSGGELRLLNRDAASAKGMATPIGRIEPLGALLYAITVEDAFSQAQLNPNARSNTAPPESDLTALLSYSRAHVDQRLGRIEQLPDELVSPIARIINIRPSISNGTAEPAEAERLFTETRTAILNLASDDRNRIELGIADLDPQPEVLSCYRAVAALFQLLHEQSQAVANYSRHVVNRQAETSALFTSAVVYKQRLIDTVGANLSADASGAWASVTGGATFAVIASTEERIASAISVATARTELPEKLGDYVRNSGDLANQIAAVAASESGRLAASAHHESDRTSMQLQITALRSLLFALATVLLAVFTVRSVVRPLQLVEERARAVSMGNLDGPPLPPIGPEDIVVVTDAMNELTVNLNRLVAQTSAVATGQFDAPVLKESLPGALGESVHATVERLRSMTQRLRRDEIARSCDS